MGDLPYISSEHIIHTELLYEYTIVLYLYKNFELKRVVGLEYIIGLSYALYGINVRNVRCHTAHLLASLQSAITRNLSVF